MGPWSLPEYLLLFSTLIYYKAPDGNLKELLRREKHEWLPRQGEVKAEVACSFSKREAYKNGVSPKDLENQLCFLVCKLKCASHPGSSKPSHPTPSKRPFTFHEHVVLLAWAVQFEVLPPELRGSRKKPNEGSPTDHLNLWKKSIDLAKVAETLAASPLWYNKGKIPSAEEVGKALDVVGEVLQPTGVEHLQTPAIARKRPSHGSISRAASRQRLGNTVDNPETQPLPEFLKEEPAVEGWIDTLQRKDGEPRDARIKKEDLGG